MAQHDQVIDNGAGLTVRTDINAALAALFSSSSGPVEPATKVPGQVWLDTATPPTIKLKIRSIDNSSWVDIIGGVGNFATGITLTGAAPSSRIGFTAADISFGARTGGNRFVWNDKPDLSGTDVMGLDESGNLTTAGFVASNTGIFQGSGTNAILAPSVSGNIILRPQGAFNTAGQAVLVPSGDFTIAGTGFISSTIFAILAATGAGGIFLRPNGAASTSGEATIASGGDLVIKGSNATKAVAGAWIAPSDSRLKDVHGEYTHGLAELLQVQPVVYTYKVRPEFGENIGVIAQDIESVLPECVTLVAGEIDGQTFDDIRQYDMTPLTYALINAVKELSAKLDAATTRIEALEAAA
jgi:hypothetical protein